MEAMLGMADEKKIFHEHGYRNIRQRQNGGGLSLAAREQAHHNNVAYALLQKSEPGIGKATIYRIYHLLMVLGFAQRLEVGDGLFRYEICSQNSGVPTHHHLICAECGSVQDVREDMLDEMERQIEEKYGFTVADHGCSFLAAVTAAKQENTEANKCKGCHIGN
ncbi:Fur family transcriptional regulator [Faecalispora jeddahensis]|uniref:Fur family transcriptional regulator n=1 Tax=Faecalispora jeddahensis TaxID=1414721 RepID=UPI00189B1C58|nr:Fur family transcriptional regulator [Faecalispora jeddahensis]